MENLTPQQNSENNTRFIIENVRARARNNSSGETFGVQHLTLHRSQSEKLFNYYKLSNLSRTTSVELLARDDGVVNKINLSEVMLERLAQFLREDSCREEKFDCFSFAHQMNGVPYEYASFDPEEWEIEEFKDNELDVGDTVFITKKMGHFDGGSIKHFAVYVDKQLFISKFGPSGKLIVTTLEEMKKGFDAEFAYKASPK